MNIQVLTLFDLEPIEPIKPIEKKKHAPKENIDDAKSAEKKINTREKKPIAKKAAETPNTNTEKTYYSIGETAQMFQVRISHIRFWTVQFALKMRTNRKGDRLFTRENIEQLRLIHHLVKVQGFTIAGAKTKLKELKHGKLEDLQKTDIISSLQSIKTTLISLRNKL
ncbi:MAG: MerR family transcriptional regulator [Phycisphaerales bacterium]|nr:MerR family transcriptional regulator [Phycisphaerales bacterium]